MKYKFQFKALICTIATAFFIRKADSYRSKNLWPDTRAIYSPTNLESVEHLVNTYVWHQSTAGRYVNLKYYQRASNSLQTSNEFELLDGHWRIFRLLSEHSRNRNDHESNDRRRSFRGRPSAEMCHQVINIAIKCISVYFLLIVCTMNECNDASMHLVWLKLNQTFHKFSHSLILIHMYVVVYIIVLIRIRISINFWNYHSLWSNQSGGILVNSYNILGK